MSDTKTLAHLLENFNPSRPANLLKEIYSKQQTFGEKFCKFKDYYSDRNRGQAVDYFLDWVETFGFCIFDELSEVLNWLPWKHWKDYTNYKVNEIEVRFELIDILHFSISLNLMLNIKPASLLKCLSTKGSDLQDLMIKEKAKFIDAEELDLPILSHELKYKYTLEYIKRILSQLGPLMDKDNLSSSIPTSPVVPEYERVISLRQTLRSFGVQIFRNLLRLFLIWDLSADDVWVYYAAKNKENWLRQERGY